MVWDRFFGRETAVCNFFVVFRSLENNNEFGENGINNSVIKMEL